MEHSIVTCIPDDGQKVLCFGHKTCCCVEDMEEIPQWHEVIFKMNICEYKLKKEIPIDPEETILDCYSVREIWKVETDGQPEYIIGVTRWKKIDAHI